MDYCTGYPFWGIPYQSWRFRRLMTCSWCSSLWAHLCRRCSATRVTHHPGASSKTSWENQLQEKRSLKFWISAFGKETSGFNPSNLGHFREELHIPFLATTLLSRLRESCCSAGWLKIIHDSHLDLSQCHIKNFWKWWRFRQVPPVWVVGKWFLAWSFR